MIPQYIISTFVYYDVIMTNEVRALKGKETFYLSIYLFERAGLDKWAGLRR